MKNGVFVIGEFIGYEEKPWPSDETKFNRRIGVKTGVYDSGFGQMQDEVESIDVFDESAIKFIKDNEEKFKGKQVMVPVVHRAKDGRNGAWMSCFMPKGKLPDLVVSK